MDRVEIYTDGACSGNPGPGGWGAVLICREAQKDVSGASKKTTTNQRMEITAAIEGLNALIRPCNVTLYSDSQYVIYTMTKGWRRRKNNDLWGKLDEAAERHEIEWKWVRGHNSNRHNERADQLAVSALKRAYPGYQDRIYS